MSVEDPDSTRHLVDRYVAQYAEYGVDSLIIALVMITKQGAANPAIVAKQVDAALTKLDTPDEPHCGNCGSVALCEC